MDTNASQPGGAGTTTGPATGDPAGPADVPSTGEGLVAGAPPADDQQRNGAPPPQPAYGWGGQGPYPYLAPGTRWLPQGTYPPSRPLQPPFSLRSPFVPGPILISLTAIVMGLGILGSTGPDLDFLAWISILVGLNIGFVWIVLLIVSAQDTRLRFDRRTWARWASQPAIFFIAIAVMTSGVPSATRFELSRQALEQAAGRVQAGGTLEPGLIGLVQVYGTSTDGDITLFRISTSEMGGCDLAYAGADASRMAKWVNGAGGTKYFGHGWWFGCLGYSGD